MTEWMLSARVRLFLLLMPVLAVLPGCASMSGFSGPDPGILRVGVTPNMPPMVFRQQGRIIGLEPDMAEMLADEMGRVAKLVPMSWESLIPALQENRIDIIMSGLSITEGRAQQVAFTEPYLKAGQMVLVRGDEVIKYQFPQLVVLSTDRIGVERGTTGEMYVQRNCRRAKVVAFASAGKATEALVKKKVDLVVHDAPVIWEMQGDFETRGLVAEPYSLTEEYLAWAVSRDNPELLDQVNAVIANWRSAGRIKVFLKRWIPGAGH